MDPKQRSRTLVHAPMYQQLVLFPERADFSPTSASDRTE
jgi:hypothetical protein